MGVLLALLSSLLWGSSDFLGGTASRRLQGVSVVGVSQAAALIGLVPLALLLGSRPDSLVAGAAAGLAGVVALTMFYSALAAGTMGVVAPVASLGVVIPVAVGLSRGESPSALQIAGILVAITGVVLASGPELTGGASVRPLLLALGAAVGFGLVAVLLAAGSAGGTGAVVVTLLLMRVSSVGALVACMLVVRRRFDPGVGRADLPLMLVIGAADVAANACFALAARSGLLSVVAVLGSLYPVVTILLARQLHAERLRPVQALGVLGTVAGIALLAAG